MARVEKAVREQSAITGGSDLGVQGLNIAGGAQGAYDPWRTLGAAGFGALLGGGTRLGAEGFSHIGARPGPFLRDGGSPPATSSPLENVPIGATAAHLTDNLGAEGVSHVGARPDPPLRDGGGLSAASSPRENVPIGGTPAHHPP